MRSILTMAYKDLTLMRRDWLGMLQLGGNVYYTFKLAACDRISMQAMGGAMSGITEEEFKALIPNAP